MTTPTEPRDPHRLWQPQRSGDYPSGQPFSPPPGEPRYTGPVYGEPTIGGDGGGGGHRRKRHVGRWIVLAVAVLLFAGCMATISAGLDSAEKLTAKATDVTEM